MCFELKLKIDFNILFEILLDQLKVLFQVESLLIYCVTL